MVNTSDFEKLSQSYIQMLSESSEVNIASFLRENYDYIENNLFHKISRMRKVSRYNVLADILKELGIKDATKENLATAISRIRIEKGVAVKRKKVKSKSASIPTKQGNTTAPKVNGVEANVVQDTELTVNNLSDMDISPNVINSIKINVDESTIDLKAEQNRIAVDLRNEKILGLAFTKRDRDLLIYFTNYAFKLNKNLFVLRKSDEAKTYNFRLTLLFFESKCKKLNFDLKPYGPSFE